MNIESVVLVDEHGRAIGTAPKEQVHHARTPLHLAFSAYLFSAAGQLLLSRRAAGKRTFPGLWTNSVCGHPAPGELLPDAVRRRARAELGAGVGQVRLVLPTFAYRAEMDDVVENELCPVYVGWLDPGAVLDPDPTEVAGIDWVDWTVFASEVLAGARAVSPWCLEQVRQLQPLGDDVRRWPGAEVALLPEAALSP